MLKRKLIDRYYKLQQYLESFIPTEKKRFPGRRGLERMRVVLSHLDNPHLKYPTVHAAGTSGKGSTVTILARILMEAGYKTGLTVSPHLQVIGERLQVSGKAATVGELEELVGEIRRAGLIRRIKRLRMGRPSYFELLLAMAFLYFAQKQVDIAVVEAGLGGKFDGTNVIKPLVGIITNVGLEHTEVLGQTVEEIAKDKAGIVKAGMTVVSGAKNVKAILSAKCKGQSANLLLLGRDFDYQIKRLTKNRSVFHFDDIYRYSEMRDLKLSLVGKHQVENAALAIAGAGAMALKEKGFSIGEKAIRQALSKVKVPGRLEVVQKKPLVVLDGAHNPPKMKALAEALSLFGHKKWVVVFAVKKDKPVKEMIERLLCKASFFIITEFRATTDVGKNMAMPLRNVVAIATKFRSFGKKGDVDFKVIPDACQAMDIAVRAAGRNGRVLVTGSLYLVGEVRERWYPKAQLLIS